MLKNQLSKFRNRLSSQKDKHSNPYARASIPAYSFDEDPVSSQSSGLSQKPGFDSPWMDDREGSESSASFAEMIFPVESANERLAPSLHPESVGHSYAESVGHVSESKQSWASSSVPEEDIDIGPSVLSSYEDAEEQFLEEYEDYFEHLNLDNIRKEQYPKLELQRIVYLDYANFALFSRFQVEEHMRVLFEEGPCLGSVSLSNASSSHMMAHVFDTQNSLLHFFNTSKSDYSVIFTTGLTAGYRLLGDSYPFQRGSLLLLCEDNHGALKHVLSAATQQGGKAILAPVGQSDLCIHTTELRRLLKKQGWHGGGSGLFIYPAQSCLSGVRHSLNWIPEAQQNGWQVLIDVSTHLPTCSLDLSMCCPDFVIGSFHHMLGYPSGMGFLLVRRQAFSIRRTGNTLKLVRPLDDGKDCHIVSEDDSVNLLSFAALKFGLDHLEFVGLLPIQKRVQSLMNWLLQTLKSLKHKVDDTKPLLQVYGPQTSKNRGSIVTFNVIDSTGNYFPATLVQRLADRNNIIVGAGYFFNPGLANILSKSTEAMHDATVFNRSPSFTALRASLGPMSTFQDVYRLAQFLSRFRDEDYVSAEAMGFIEEEK